ncbi:hypothetical protein ACP70R_017207 [Stipagrostis hirtigluma subsp. patula]
MRSSVLLVAIVVVYAVAAPTTAIPGGWSPIKDINDPHIQELGEWAVTEHVKQANDGLKFSRVVSGDQQVVAGVNYRLVVDASNNDGKDAKYQAVVYEREWTNTRELVSFKPVN